MLYLRLIRNMDVRIRLIPKRENPPTITANKACSTGKPGHVASIPKKVSEVGTGKLVAATLITESQGRPERRLESQGNRQKTDSTSRESPEPGLVNTGFEQD